jgi:hypothetical protein
MNKERSLANTILLFVYPLFYLLMLVASALFGVYVVRDNPVKLAAIVIFGLYLCYRLVTRVTKLVQAFSTGQTEETEDSDPSAS